jgi:hypothetical protein
MLHDEGEKVFVLQPPLHTYQVEGVLHVELDDVFAFLGILEIPVRIAP